MTESIAKKIGFGLLVLGLLAGTAGMVSAQTTSTGTASSGTSNNGTPPKQDNESWAEYNQRVAAQQKSTGQVVSTTQKEAGGFSDSLFWQQTVNSASYNIERLAKQAELQNRATTVATIDAVQKIGDVEVLGISMTGNLGQRATAAMVKMGGDDAAKWVASSQGISAENLDKVSKGTGGGLFGTGFGSRNAIDYKLDNGTVVHMAADLTSTEGMMEGCMPIPVKLDQLKNCIFCPLFLVLYNTSEAMATSSFEVLAKGFKTLLILGFALYIAYITLRQVSAFTKQDAPKYITEALTMTFKVVLAWLLLTHGVELYRLGLEPLLSAGIEFGQTFLTHQNVNGTNVDIKSCVDTTGTISGATTYFYSHNLYQKIDCFLRKVTQEIAVSQSIGSSLMCVARHKASGVVMWDLTMMVTGLIMWLFAWLICLAFAFYLIDSVIRLGIIGAILPFLVAAWPFKITSGYTGKGWSMFLNAFFTFVFLGLVVSINVELSAQAATGGATVESTITDGGDTTTKLSSGVDAIMDLVNSNDVESLLQVMSIGLSGLIFMILCCIFGFKLCAESASLAGQLAEAKGKNLGSLVGSAAAGAAKGVATRGAKAAGKVAVAGGRALANSETGQKMQAGLNNKIKSSFLGRFAATPAGRNIKANAQNTGGQPNGGPAGGSYQGDENNTPETNNNAIQNAQQQQMQQQQTEQTGGNNNTPERNRDENQGSGSRPTPAASQQSNNNNVNNNENNESQNSESNGVNEAQNADNLRTTASTFANDSRQDLNKAAHEAADQAVADATRNKDGASQSDTSHSGNSGGSGSGNGSSGNNENKKNNAEGNGESQNHSSTVEQLRSEIAELQKKLENTSGASSSERAASEEKIRALEAQLNRLQNNG